MVVRAQHRNRGLRSYLCNETNFNAIEGHVWGMGAKWRPYPRDQGIFIAVRDGTDMADVLLLSVVSVVSVVEASPQDGAGYAAGRCLRF